MGRRSVKEHRDEVLARNANVRAEYDRLGPRYEMIRLLIATRKRAGLTQSELAARMGKSQSVVARLESAEHSPRFDSILDYARACGFDASIRFVRLREIDLDRPA